MSTKIIMAGDVKIAELQCSDEIDVFDDETIEIKPIELPIDRVKAIPEWLAIWNQVMVMPVEHFIDAMEAGATESDVLKADRAMMDEYRKAGAEANREAREALKEQMGGKDIVDFAHERGDSLESFDSTAKLMGYRTSNWSDQKNVTRRAKTREKAYKNNARAERLKESKPAPARATNAPAAPAGSMLPAIPEKTDRELLAKWARDYCRALCDLHQSHKLTQKLFGRVEGGGSLNYQISVMPLDDVKLTTWAHSAQLSFDKKVGA